jgi:ubiquinone/menaquinone biosynthesis C-methylase UbiE
MNRLHQWLCRSDRWRSTVAQRLPWAVGDADLGPNVLEIGPGPGLTTDLLRTSVPRLTALEIDATLASSLSSRLKGSDVQVIEGDATEMPFGDSEFSGAVSFTMLHHVPSQELQDKVLAQVLRVLKPGGFFVGSDSLQNWFMRIIHIGDTLVPVNPDSFGARLERAGFEVLEVQKNSQAFRFRARRPLASPVKTRIGG